MGRVSDKQSYQIKNTFVELAPAADDGDFSRGQRAMSDMGAGGSRPGESPGFIPQTPSPFMSAQPDPYCMPYPMMDQSQMGGSVLPALAFGDFAPEDCSQGYNCGEAANPFAGMQYDPSTGTFFVPYDGSYLPYDANCYNMVDQGQMQDTRAADEHTQVLLAALSEKLGEDQIQVSGDASLDPNAVALNANGEDLANPDMEGWDNTGAEYYEGGAWGNGNMMMGGAGYNTNEDMNAMGSQVQQPSRRKAERREAREAARRQQQAAAATISAEGGNSGMEDKCAVQWGGEAQKQGPSGCITTVMFRNIPNKYTREMLVNQLEQDMRGLFDFIYLPIDFKNKCNVGYAFINFRTVEACDTFVNRFNGVEVRKCLPGLNSRKVTEVTPARVQGFEENVQRLRNSPVMRELIHKPEWMPLIFDYNGDQIPFPSPERPLEPIKPRRRARDDEARLL